MNWDDVFRLIGASLFSVFSAGALVIGLASWLGKLWAERILRNETHKLQEQLAQTQSSLNNSLERSKRELDFLKESRSNIHNDKIAIYRKIIDMVAKLLANLDLHHAGRLQPTEGEHQYDQFNEQRMQVYGYLAMFAPQTVIDAQDRLIDHLILISNGHKAYIWSEVRELALSFINEVRQDVGIDKSAVQYKGSL
jgi:hypothetical protein